MDEYPSDTDLTVAIEEKYGLRKMQYHLQRKSQLLAHTNSLEEISKAARRARFGYSNLYNMKREIMENDVETKSTAFYITAEATNEALLHDLESITRSESDVLNENIKLSIERIRGKEDSSIDITLGYTKTTSTKRDFISSQDKSVSIRISPELTNNTRTVNVDYRMADEFRATVKFFEGWRADRIHRKKNPINVLNIDIRMLGLEERVKFFRNIFTYNPEKWRFNHVSKLGIEKEPSDDEDLSDEERKIVLEEKSELEAEIEQRLEGLTAAILQGRNGLLESTFVSDCLDQGFYFDSARIFLTEHKGISAIEVDVEFKQDPRPSFSVSFEQYYEKEDGGYVEKPPTGVDTDSIRDLFRGIVINRYAEYTEQSELIKEEYEKPLTELPHIGPELAERIENELNITTIPQMYNADSEDLKSIEGVGDAIVGHVSKE